MWDCTYSRGYLNWENYFQVLFVLWKLNPAEAWEGADSSLIKQLPSSSFIQTGNPSTLFLWSLHLFFHSAPPSPRLTLISLLSFLLLLWLTYANGCGVNVKGNATSRYSCRVLIHQYVMICSLFTHVRMSFCCICLVFFFSYYWLPTFLTMPFKSPRYDVMVLYLVEPS